MNINEINKIHLIGIGGIGVSAIAKLFLSYGKSVTGSDVYQTDITKDLEKRGVKINYQHNENNLADDIDLVIYSPAVPKDNPERQKALKLDIKQLSYPEFLGELSRQMKTIAIAGTNGKSTTTAMIGKIFESAGLDPTVIVGTQVSGFDGNLRVGQSDLLIIEACEWKAHMLHLSPQTIVLTNLELDHLDFYKDINDLKEHFQKFIDALPSDGFLAYNVDDKNLQDLSKNKGYQAKSWGIFNNSADYTASVETQNLASLQSKGQKYQLFNVGGIEYKLKIPGQYNICNALSAITVAKQFDINGEVIKKTLFDFPNCWRRFEILGQIKNKPETLVVSDYAHHPTAIKGVIKAAKEFYPDKRLFAVFQPHHYDRTAKLFDGFVKSFAGADILLINEVYDVAGRKQDGERSVSSKDLVEAIKKIQPNKEIIYSPNLEQTKKIILEKVQFSDLALIIGAGDIDEVARGLVK